MKGIAVVMFILHFVSMYICCISWTLSIHVLTIVNSMGEAGSIIYTVGVVKCVKVSCDTVFSVCMIYVLQLGIGFETC